MLQYFLVKPFHLFVVVHNLISLYYDFNYLVVPQNGAPDFARPGFGGRSRFLTYWCLVSLKYKKKIIKNPINIHEK